MNPDIFDDEYREWCRKEDAKKGKFISDRRSVKLEEISKPNYIPLFGGRPNRDKVIGNEDLIDLKISIETIKDVNEFLMTV